MSLLERNAKKIALTEWYVVRRSHPVSNYDGKNFYIQVEGRKVDNPTHLVRTGRILQRVKNRCDELRSSDNFVYQLCGTFCEDIASLLGYPENLLKIFKNGFPDDWFSILVKFYEKKDKLKLISEWDELELAAMQILQGRSKNRPASMKGAKNTFASAQNGCPLMLENIHKEKCPPDDQSLHDVPSVSTVTRDVNHAPFLSPILNIGGKCSVIRAAPPICSENACPFVSTSTPVKRKLLASEETDKNISVKLRAFKRGKIVEESDCTPTVAVPSKSQRTVKGVPKTVSSLTAKNTGTEFYGSPTDTDADILRLAANVSLGYARPVDSCVKKTAKKNKKYAARVKKLGGVDENESVVTSVSFNRTKYGRLVKPRLQISAGQRLVYDFHGNPIELIGGDAKFLPTVDLTAYAEQLNVSKLTLKEIDQNGQEKIVQKISVKKPEIVENRSAFRREKIDQSKSRKIERNSKNLPKSDNRLQAADEVDLFKRKKGTVKYARQIQKSIPKKNKKSAPSTRQNLKKNLGLTNRLKNTGKMFKLQQKKGKNLNYFRLDPSSDEDQCDSEISDDDFY